MPGVKEMADEATGKTIQEDVPPEAGMERAVTKEAAMAAEGGFPSEATPEEDALQAKETLGDMICGIAACAVLIGMIGSIFSGPSLPFLMGLLLGAGTAELMLWHMYAAIARALDMDADSAAKYMKKSATLRILMAAAAFAISAFLPRVFYLPGVLVGTLCLKFSAYLQPLTHKALKNFRKGR